jgi:hypothetical protein
MFKNWRTSLFGLGALITGVATILHGEIPGGITAIISGLGLFAAKDADNGLQK